MRPLPALSRSRRNRCRRAVEANRGIRARYAREITKLINSSNMLLINFVLCDLRDSGYTGFTDVVTTAHDANPFTALKGFGKRAVKAMTDILLGMGKTIKQISHWFCTGMIKSTTAAQVDAMRKAGLSEAFIREKWNTHQIGGQYIAPEVEEIVPKIIQDQTTLITRLASEDLQRIQTAVVTSLDAGVNINDLEATLRGISGFSPRRAQLVAMDQTNKLNITVQRANDLSLGFTRAVWIHVPGEFTSRETHREFNGQEFDLQEGMYDIDVGHNVQCAELPYCRCVYRTIIPDVFEDLGSKK